jgi:hypothetical protein
MPPGEICNLPRGNLTIKLPPSEKQTVAVAYKGNGVFKSTLIWQQVLYGPRKGCRP